MPDPAVQKFKKAIKKSVEPVALPQVNILGTIKAELAQEYAAREKILTEAHDAKVAELANQLDDVVRNSNNHAHNIAKLEAQLAQAKQEREVAEMRLGAYEKDTAKLNELADREAKLTEERNKFIAEREDKINDIVNTRTQRMKDKLDEEFKLKYQSIAAEVINVQDAQASKLYNEIASLMRDSKMSVYILTYVIEMVKQSLMVEERRRIGIDAKLASAAPAVVPPTKS